MTTIQIQLPDDLAQTAEQAGLLTPDAVAAMLREQLRKQAGGSLQAMWATAPTDDVTPEIEQMVASTVRAVRAARRNRTAS
jgi:hypothetical protein